MRKRLSAIVIGLIAATSLSGAVMAADVPQVVPETFDWTGFYFGGHVGWGWIDLNGAYDTGEDDAGDFVDDNAGDFDLDDDNILAGFQAGFNWQIDHLVLGIEGDVSFVDWEDELTNDDDEQVSFDTNFLISLRARAGFALDHLLVYATAGGAWTDTEFEANDDVSSAAPDEEGDLDLDDIGFVVGGGAEVAIDENLSLKAEGLYYIFDQDESIEDLTDDTDEDDFIELDDIFVARIGLNLRF